MSPPGPLVSLAPCADSAKSGARFFFGIFFFVLKPFVMRIAEGWGQIVGQVQGADRFLSRNTGPSRAVWANLVRRTFLLDSAPGSSSSPALPGPETTAFGC